MVHPAPLETLSFIQGVGWMEVVVLLLLGVLIFGKRLPEVGKSLGRGIVEFKRGLSGIDDEINIAAKRPPSIEKHSPDQVSPASGSPEASSAPPAKDESRQSA